MPFLPTTIPGVIIFEPKMHGDERGYFFESYNEAAFNDALREHAGIETHFVQDNQSSSAYGVIRGLHFQNPPYTQAKLIRVLQGRILDVAVDIRKGSPTYGEVFSIELSARNKKQLFVPRGFAHGFSVLSKTAEVFYKCDAFYNKESDGGISYKDPALNIDWKIPAGKETISPKDSKLPLLADLQNEFRYKEK